MALFTATRGPADRSLVIQATSTADDILLATREEPRALRNVFMGMTTEGAGPYVFGSATVHALLFCVAATRPVRLQRPANKPKRCALTWWRSKSALARRSRGVRWNGPATEQ